MDQKPELKIVSISDILAGIPNEKKPTRAEEVALLPPHALSGFPLLYRGLSLGFCRRDAENYAAIDACARWAAGKTENLFLWGPQGTGKTHLACAAASASVYRSARFIRVPEMLLELQASVQDHDELDTLKQYLASSRRDIFEKETTARIFDDVGAHRVSDFAIEMFGLVLEKYYSSCWRGLILTSNLSPRKILETMGERISSRLCGLCEPVEVSGKDQRLEQRTPVQGSKSES